MEAVLQNFIILVEWMNMMKEIKKRRFSSKVFLVVLILVVVAGIFIVVQRGKIKEDSKSILENNVLLLWIERNMKILIDLILRMAMI